MTDLEKAKVAYAEADIQREIAVAKYNEAKQKLIIELNKNELKQPPEVKATE